ncbi:MAG TPA: LLM class F420-dependent oxidoreductase [Acidimicrobiales bacterium]|nr:LLM class F420-dependent oxidoreductase [Acidimicrobiales bacterium]
MKLGIAIFPTDTAVDVVALAREVEDRGFESFFLPEHTHIPVGEAQFPTGAPVQEHYKRSLDPFVALGAVAAATSRLLLGTGICLVVERDPIVTAKEVATVDLLSGGRFLFGIGGGWNRLEMANHGTDARTRFALMKERVEAMKAIWTADEAEYHGRFVDFDPIWLWPKPVQRPHPPVLVGGNGAGTLRRVVEYGDEWMPNAFAADAFAERIVELQRLAEEAGREPVLVTANGCKPEARAVERYAEIGVDRCTFWVPSASRDEVMPLVDRYAELVEQVGGS